ncbi:type III pantothenate kinase [Mucilaginibacter arboris]|uniref:Type III pantothenate kinase n=1 Tax=Mucilaginibacter arboris TaxID=2682090 RepID=A0A7K1SRN4_9SPHI|nr:type III pantothenate kinase [Mucilaginibacter arboris]MVN19988.1 type III pantothenate kinase [Mucilaginibacter arboris]
MVNLVFDIGNTFAKVAVFKEQNILWTKRYRQITETLINKILIKFKPERAIISSVQNKIFLWEAMLEKQLQTFRFQYQMAKTISNHYENPEKLGLDRLAAVVGARFLYPKNSNLVIDAGTCVTYDAIDVQGNYYGGSISPGLKMRFKALKHFTKKLPLIEAEQGFEKPVGNNTKEAILSGVQNGLLFEAEGFIKKQIEQQQHTNILLTGGDLNFFDTHLKSSIFAAYVKPEPYLVLKGLNAVIHQQE